MEARPGFAGVLVASMLGRQIEKTLFRRKYIRMGPLLTTTTGLFEVGGMLGRVFKDHHTGTFISVFHGTTDLTKTISWMTTFADEVYRMTPHATTIHEVVITMLRLSEPDCDPAQAFKQDWTDWLFSHAGTRFDFDGAFEVAFNWTSGGAAFGIKYSNRFAQLLANEYERRDKMYTGVGSESPEERERDYMQMFKAFCSTHYPETLKPLGLA